LGAAEGTGKAQLTLVYAMIAILFYFLPAGAH
jgi:hypothetical protein